MSEIPVTPQSYDYSGLPSTLADSLKSRAQRIREIGGKAIVDIGKELAVAQDELAGHHGGFQAWAEAETGLSRGAIYNAINVYKKFGDHPNFGHLPKSALYLLAAPSTPDDVRDDIIERATSGEKITVQDVKEAISPPEPDPELRNQLRSFTLADGTMIEIAYLPWSERWQATIRFDHNGEIQRRSSAGAKTRLEAFQDVRFFMEEFRRANNPIDYIDPDTGEVLTLPTREQISDQLREHGSMTLAELAGTDDVQFKMDLRDRLDAMIENGEVDCYIRPGLHLQYFLDRSDLPLPPQPEPEAPAAVTPVRSTGRGLPMSVQVAKDLIIDYLRSQRTSQRGFWAGEIRRGAGIRDHDQRLFHRAITQMLDSGTLAKNGRGQIHFAEFFDTEPEGETTEPPATERVEAVEIIPTPSQHSARVKLEEYMDELADLAHKFTGVDSAALSLALTQQPDAISLMQRKLNDASQHNRTISAQLARHALAVRKVHRQHRSADLKSALNEEVKAEITTEYHRVHDSLQPSIDQLAGDHNE